MDTDIDSKPNIEQQNIDKVLYLNPKLRHVAQNWLSYYNPHLAKAFCNTQHPRSLYRSHQASPDNSLVIKELDADIYDGCKQKMEFDTTAKILAFPLGLYALGMLAGIYFGSSKSYGPYDLGGIYSFLAGSVGGLLGIVIGTGAALNYGTSTNNRQQPMRFLSHCTANGKVNVELTGLATVLKKAASTLEEEVFVKQQNPLLRTELKFAVEILQPQ
jgi:hypothetical protein